jgi:hypothetical protein
MFDNRVVWRIFGPNRDEVTGHYRRLNNEELHTSMCSAVNIIRMIKSRRTRWAGHVALMGGIKMELREIGWKGVDWIQLAQDRDKWRAFVNMVMKLRAS